MPKIYKVTVDPGYRWSVVTVAGRHFSKRTVTEIQEGDMTEEIRNSPLLKVEVEVEAKAEVKRRGRKGG